MSLPPLDASEEEFLKDNVYLGITAVTALNHTQANVIAVACDAVRGTTVNVLRDSFFSGVHIIFLINIIIWLLSILFFALIRKYAFSDEEKLKSTRNETPLDNPPPPPSLFSFIKTTFNLTDTQFHQKCGSSAVQYLRFQRFIWDLLFWITMFSLVLILPANMYGMLNLSPTSFGRTTIANLTPDSSLIWLHSVAALLYIFLGIKLMRKFKKSTITVSSSAELQSSSEVLIISDLPRFQQKSAAQYGLEIKKHLETAYHSCKVEHVQFAFNYAECIGEYEKILELKTALELNSLVVGCPEAESNYITELEKNKVQFRESIERSCRLPVVFVHVSQANRINTDFNHGLGTPSASPFYKRLRVEHWTVEKCPLPADIFWSGLAQRCSNYYWLRTVMINCALFIIMLFFTTPSIAVSNMEKIKWFNLDLSKVISNPSFSWITNFIPTLMLWSFSALLPHAVAALSALEGHWTISGCNLMTMQRTFYFLIFMVLILPSLGLASFDIVLEHLFKNATASSVANEAFNRFQCIFLPDNGAFFVNYVITSAFIGTGLELLRLPELILFLIKRCSCKTKTEALLLKKERFFEFQYGLQYAWMLTIVATTIVFSIVCPVITPFGLFYMTLKHQVDKYNLYYAYKGSIIDIECHRSAVRYVLLSLYLLLVSVLFFTIIRADTSQGYLYGFYHSPQAIFLLAVIAIYLIVRCFGKLKFEDLDEEEQNDMPLDSSPHTGNENRLVYVPDCILDCLNGTFDVLDKDFITTKFGLNKPRAGGLLEESISIESCQTIETEQHSVNQEE